LKKKRFLLKAATLGTGAILVGCANDIIAVRDSDSGAEDSPSGCGADVLGLCDSGPDGPFGTVVHDGGNPTDAFGTFDSGPDGPFGVVIQDGGGPDGPFGVVVMDGGGPNDAEPDGPFGVVVMDGGGD